MFRDLVKQLDSTGPSCRIAEHEQSTGAYRRARWLVCGLVDPARLGELGGNLGFEVSTSGPWPTPSTDSTKGCTPEFSIHGGAAHVDIEPLVLSWESNSQTVLQPDPGLLMTYGLVPRGTDLIKWDEPRFPRHGVMTVQPLSVFDFATGAATHAFVEIDRDFLQDYATLRGKAVVCVFKEIHWAEHDDEVEALLGDEADIKFHADGWAVRCQRVHGDGHRLFVEASGHRVLVQPGPLPVSDEDARLGSLEWPGIDGAIDAKSWRRFRPSDKVFVRDAVLARYEGRPEYQIIPHLGSVSYGGQWGVDYCRRVGRDFISLEVKKLYEGCPPEVIHHWHKHAADPPQSVPPTDQDEPNVATRAKRLVFACCDLGEAIATLASATLDRTVTPAEAIGLDRRELEYRGWWLSDAVVPITRHIPVDMTPHAFIARCKDLNILIAEGLSEGKIRRLLIDLGTDKESIKPLRTLRLLDRVVRLARICSDAGYTLPTDYKAVLDRFAEEPAADDTTSPCRRLLALNKLRQLDSHAKGDSSQRKLRGALEIFSIDLASTKPGYGLAADAVYDALAEELIECASVINAAMHST